MKPYNELYVSWDSKEIASIELERMCSRLVIKDRGGNLLSSKESVLRSCRERERTDGGVSVNQEVQRIRK